MKKNFFFILFILHLIFSNKLFNLNNLNNQNYLQKNLKSNQNLKSKIAFWSSWNIKCGIAVYLSHICKALKKKQFIIKIYKHNINTKVLVQNLLKNKINILHIQYEPCLFPNEKKFFDVIKSIKEKKIKIIITVHWETNFLNKIKNYVDCFIYHKPPKLLQSKNIYILPMGVPVFESKNNKNQIRERYGFNKDDIIITTTGFLLPWKEYSSVLEHLVPLIKSNEKYKIQLLTAFNDVTCIECLKELKKIKNVIEKYEIDKQVQLITEFIPQSELSERLWISDIGYLWGNLNSKGSSASLKEFISARLPLITTKCSHFDDINLGTIKTGFSKLEFVEMIKKILNNKEKLYELKKEQCQQYEKLNYDFLIQQYIKVLY